MAEMVPVEFWSYMNSALKMKNPEAFLLAEVYNPSLYRDYIHKGKMDYLYDKVELYDTLKHIMQGHGSTDNLPAIYTGLADIEHHMLHFLENHDEQRIASAGFAGSAEKGKPAMVVSTCLSTSPTMLYFGQNVGEPGDGDMGFGDETRTSIFDYCGVPAHQRWMNNGKFDGGRSTPAEKELNGFYKTLLSFSAKSPVLMGEYKEIHAFNRKNTEGYTDKVFSFVRWKADDRLIIVSNFEGKAHKFQLKLDAATVQALGLKDSSYVLEDKLSGNKEMQLVIKNGIGSVKLELAALQSFILSVQ